MYKYMIKKIQIDFKEQNFSVTLTISLISFSLSCDVRLQKLVSEKKSSFMDSFCDLVIIGFVLI